MTGPKNEAKPSVTVVCEKHGLRYNPQLHSGCVRCRKEAGEPIGAVSATARGAASARQGGSIAAALAVTVVLVLISSGVFYAIHKSNWDAAKEARERWMEEGAAAALTPEQQEQLKKIEKMMDRLKEQ